MNEKVFNPLISIIIPTYNKSYVIEDTIKIVLNQTWKNIEIIIINDASTDDAESILKKQNDKRIKLITNKNNLGVCASRELGIKKSIGEFICFLDDDDYWIPNHIETLIKVMKKTNSQITISNYKTNINNNFTEYDMRSFCNNFKKLILTKQGPFLQCCMFRKFIFNEGVSFDSQSTPCEDWDIFIQISKMNYVISHSNHTGFTWNLSENSQSSNLNNEVEALNYIVSKNTDLIIDECGKKILSDHFRFIARVYEKIGRYDMATIKYKEAFLISKGHYKNIFYRILLLINIKCMYDIINLLRNISSFFK